MNPSRSERRIGTRELVLAALFAALTYVATWLINIRLPLAGTGGLIHLGNVPLFWGAMIFGPFVGAFAGAIGMGLFDLMSGWAAWAPFTFVIVGLMGWVVGIFAKKRPLRNRFFNDLTSLILALLIKLAGYYLAELLLTGNPVAPLGSVPGNVLQVGCAAVIALLTVPALRKALRFQQLTAFK